MAASEHEPVPSARVHGRVEEKRAVGVVERVLFGALRDAVADAWDGWISETEYRPGMAVGVELSGLQLDMVAQRVLYALQQEKDGTAIAAAENTNEGNE